MVLPRVPTIARGYEDCNDLDALRPRYGRRAAPPDARPSHKRYREEAS